MATRLRQLLLLLTLFTMSMQSLRPAVAMHCGCQPATEQPSNYSAAPLKCQCDPASQSCCCGGDQKANSNDPISAHCSCSHNDVPPAVPTPNVSVTLDIELSLSNTVRLAEILPDHPLQGRCSTAQCIGDPHPRGFAQLCFNHWLI